GEEAAYAQQAAILAINASPDKDAKIQRLAANISRSAAPRDPEDKHLWKQPKIKPAEHWQEKELSS
ncbi:hypothetical protein, partial [Sphingobacterium daejeonense]|uniref:hypothetical protein n=1 Tax=Sphingobacterium daejeonense TaxID=371142 RepID=UPI003D31E10D